MTGKIAEMVEREAAQAEAEHPADEGDAAEAGELDDKPAEDEGEGEGAEVDTEALQRGIEKAHATYERQLGKALGEQWALYQECDRCGSMGYTPPDFVPFKPALDKPACDACNGYGRQETASRNDQHRFEQCGTCNGNGWVLRALPEPVPYQPTPYQQPATQGWGQQPNGQESTSVPSSTDAWGRPTGHRDFGIPPHLVNA